MDTWPFPIKPARDHLYIGIDQGHSVLRSLKSADLHPWDEGEGHTGRSCSALLLALLGIVDHQDFHVRGLSVLVLPLRRLHEFVWVRHRGFSAWLCGIQVGIYDASLHSIHEPAGVAMAYQHMGVDPYGLTTWMTTL